MPGWVGILDGIIVDVAVPIQLLRVHRPAATLPPHPLRRCIIRCHSKWATARDNRIRANEPANRRVVIPRIIEQQPVVLQ